MSTSVDKDVDFSRLFNVRGGINPGITNIVAARDPT